MMTTVVVVLCKLLVPTPTLAPMGDCTDEEAMVEEIVTDTTLDEEMTYYGCMIHGQIGVADWKSKHPIYSKDAWRIAKVKCVPGIYVLKGRA